LQLQLCSKWPALCLCVWVPFFVVFHHNYAWPMFDALCHQCTLLSFTTYFTCHS
jgi:hypothetical protein